MNLYVTNRKYMNNGIMSMPRQGFKSGLSPQDTLWAQTYLKRLRQHGSNTQRTCSVPSVYRQRSCLRQPNYHDKSHWWVKTNSYVSLSSMHDFIHQLQNSWRWLWGYKTTARYLSVYCALKIGKSAWKIGFEKTNQIFWLPALPFNI